MTDTERDADVSQAQVCATQRQGTRRPPLLPLDLLAIIETQIVPRLSPAPRTDVETRDARGRVRVQAFLRTILRDGFDEAHAQASALLAKGLSLETLFLDVLAPTAVCLGDLWASDELSFSEVTLASYKLHQLVRAFGAFDGASDDQAGGRILLTTAPFNKHTLGVLMVEDFFQRAGWTVLSLPASSGLEIIDAVQREWFAVIGLSMSCDIGADQLPGLIAAIRAASLNKAIVVLLGGSYFDAQPELAVEMGADVNAGDARHAVTQGTLLSNVAALNASARRRQA